MSWLVIAPLLVVVTTAVCTLRSAGDHGSSARRACPAPSAMSEPCPSPSDALVLGPAAPAQRPIRWVIGPPLRDYARSGRAVSVHADDGRGRRYRFDTVLGPVHNSREPARVLSPAVPPAPRGDRGVPHRRSVQPVRLVRSNVDRQLRLRRLLRHRLRHRSVVSVSRDERVRKRAHARRHRRFVRHDGDTQHGRHGPAVGNPRRVRYRSRARRRAVGAAARGVRAEIRLVPFQFWVPAAYTAAPTPVTAMFAGVTKKVGIYAIIRLYFTVFATASVPVDLLGTTAASPLAFLAPVLGAMGVASIVVGGFGAVGQDRLERVRVLDRAGRLHRGSRRHRRGGSPHGDAPRRGHCGCCARVLHSTTRSRRDCSFSRWLPLRTRLRRIVCGISAASPATRRYSREPSSSVSSR